MCVSHKDHKRVAVKLCGHCSPRRDMMELAEELKGSAEDLTFTYYSRCPEADILLILNTCEAACAERPDFSGPVVTVTPETVDHWPVKSDFLAAAILDKIATYF